ncbi:ABC transporter ATP-binding protein [Thalassobius sp. Cn5-15]|uniref:ABC transporter ATP-binding protein n=1 Tax=Thalassobius sp. Cn5-15 TaxID=2917763 RepID=UPI001EF33BB7|nr:ABC transporter ATP-binding protein [Thalassobius sp. Cn5-15]MCG7492169.1 ABC transporter ATP-binding protein [Thalassobius sp. Cn5-15]
MGNILDVKNLTLNFRTDEGLIQPVRNVSFSLEKGKTLGIVGESGSGKSVSTKAIMQLLPGTASIAEESQINYVMKDGQSIDLAKVRARDPRMGVVRGGEIGMIFQEPMASFSPIYTIGNQIMEAIRLHRGLNKRQARELAIEMLDKVGLTNPSVRVDQFPHEMSGGMRQRAMIALALSAGPQLLIADEPTTALDVTIQAQVLQLMRDLQSELGMSMIFITHDLGVVAQVADDIAVMYKGEIVERGTVREVINNPQQAYTQRLLDAVPRLDKVVPPAPLKKARKLMDVTNLGVEFELRNKKLFRTEVETVRAVSDITFDILKGETVGLVGESGSGKTTVGRAMLRAIDPSEGEVIFHRKNKGDIDLAHASEAELREVRSKINMAFHERPVQLHNLGGKLLRNFRPEMSLVFQDPYSSLNPRMTVRDIIAEPLVASGLMKDREQIDERVREIAARCKIDLEHLRRFPHAFSGGQRQRICIARALVSKPKFVVCDECVSALDVSIQAEIVALLKDVQAELGVSFLFIAHDLAVVAQISHRVAVMYRGRFMEYGPTDKIFFNPQHPYTKALLSAVPHPDPDIEFKPTGIEGGMIHPVASSSPDGVSLRIPDQPSDEPIQLVEVDEGHFVACHLDQQATVQRTKSLEPA